jgi:hypothetical protein
MEFPQALFEQPTVRASCWQRISSQEEERVREGYLIETCFRIPAGLPARRLVLAEDAGREPAVEGEYIPQARWARRFA